MAEHDRMELTRSGGWYPITDLAQKCVVTVAKLAVEVLEEHNKLNNLNLSFDSVVRGREHMVAGSVYRMIIAVKDGGAAHLSYYEVEAWFRPWLKDHTRCILKSFEKVNG